VSLAPYYTTPCGSVRIYHARWEDVLAAGVFDPREVKLIHADPPYGAGLAMKPDANSKELRRYKKKASPRPIWPDIAGATGTFDPQPLLLLSRPLVAWGANHYADRMPSSPAWIVWDKRDQKVVNDQADCELAWTNLGGPARMFVYYWNGFSRESEIGAHYHPTQKPEALSAYVFQRAKLKRGDLVLVPYMGSGPDLRPAMAMGLQVVACEVEENYCKTAVNARLRAVAKPEAHEALGPLFGGT
jgi:site-specific DNA-methyltransferase (adenine-specific)